MPETTDPTGNEPPREGDDDGTVHPDGTQIGTKPPIPKSNPLVIFIAGFVAGLLVGAAAMATCGGSMGSQRQAASPPVEQPVPR